MVKASTLITGLVAALPTALALPGRGSSSNNGGDYCQSYVAKFDDLPSLVPASVIPIGVYQGLNYDAFYVATTGVAGLTLTGVLPASSPNSAAYGLYGNILAGSVPTINTSGTNTKSFRLSQFRFGCAVNTAETAAGVPTPCTVTAVGYNTAGEQVYTQSFDFNPGTLALATPMATATLEKTWTGLSSVTFSTSNSVGVLTGTLIDNVVYCTQS